MNGPSSKVIAVALDLRDPERSGLARVASSMARAFVSRHADEFDITLAGPVEILEKLGARAWGRARLVDWRSSRYTLADFSWPRANARAGRAIWYYPHWDVPVNAMAAPFVVTMHDLAHLRLPGHSPLKRFVARSWISGTLSRARRVMAGSRYSAREAADEWPSIEPKLSVVYHGVEEAFFGSADPVAPDVAARLGGEPFMLSVGIRKERKNLRMGVEVLRQVPGLRWVVVGDWFPEWEQVAGAAAQAGVSDRMVVLDRQSDASLRSLYAAAAFLFFPSRYEGFGLPIVEALASGAPVVASTTTSTGEVLGDAGWLCDPDDTACFVRAAREILALGPRRGEIADRGRARAREFTWERSAVGLADAFRAAAASR